MSIDLGPATRSETLLDALCVTGQPVAAWARGELDWGELLQSIRNQSSVSLLSADR